MTIASATLERAQGVAIASPCLLEQETARPRFSWQPWGVPLSWTLVLTVNSGYE